MSDITGSEIQFKRNGVITEGMIIDKVRTSRSKTDEYLVALFTNPESETSRIHNTCMVVPDNILKVYITYTMTNKFPTKKEE